MGGGKEPFLFVGRPICADLMSFPIGKTPMPETRMVERAFIVLLAYMLTLAGKSKAYYLIMPNYTSLFSNVCVNRANAVVA